MKGTIGEGRHLRIIETSLPRQSPSPSVFDSHMGCFIHCNCLDVSLGNQCIERRRMEKASMFG